MCNTSLHTHIKIRIHPSLKRRPLKHLKLVSLIVESEIEVSSGIIMRCVHFGKLCLTILAVCGAVTRQFFIGVRVIEAEQSILQAMHEKIVQENIPFRKKYELKQN